MSRFVLVGDLVQQGFDWGEISWRSIPSITGSQRLGMNAVRLEPGCGHDFHRHPDQEVMIVVQTGQIEQWIERERQVLAPGDSVYIDSDVVHASFNTGDGPALLQVVLTPAVGELGYELVDVSGEEPWASLRS